MRGMRLALSFRSEFKKRFHQDLLEDADAEEADIFTGDADISTGDATSSVRDTSSILPPTRIQQKNFMRRF